MLGGLRRRRQSLHSRTGSSLRRRNDVELVLWGVPLAMVGVSSFLILSIERQEVIDGIASFQFSFVGVLAFINSQFWLSQLATALVGCGIALLFANLRLERLKPPLLPIYIVTVISLIAVRFIGTSALGAQRWISIGGVHVQPSEFAKLAAILLVSGRTRSLSSGATSRSHPPPWCDFHSMGAGVYPA